MDESVLLLVDHANLLYRAYYGAKVDADIKPWLGILRYLNSLRVFCLKVQEEYPGHRLEFIFAGESHKKLKRNKISEGYKSHRKTPVDISLKNFRKAVLETLNDCGWKLLCKDGAEADDVIASIAASAIDKDVVIFSNDRDLRQLLSYSHVSIYQSPGVFYGVQDFHNDYSFHPRDFVYFKALVGDKSDGLAGVQGWGPVKSKKHILAGDWLEVLEEEGLRSEYEGYLSLVRLDYSLDVPIDGKVMKLKEFYPNKLIKELYSVEAVDEVRLYLQMLEEVACQF